MTKILIIEDDQTINQMYRMKFEATGFDVMMASDGEMGLKIGEKFHPDMILLDLQMPNMDGATTLKHLRASTWGKDKPVVILTNLGAEEAPKSIHSLNVSSYVVKAEFTPSQVVALVKETLGIE